MIRPKPETLEIVYNIHRTESWDMHTTALDNFLAGESPSSPLWLWFSDGSLQMVYCFELANILN